MDAWFAGVLAWLSLPQYGLVTLFLVALVSATLLPLDLLLPHDRQLADILANRTPTTWEGTPLWIVTVPGLRSLKRLRDSAQDRADLEGLGPESP